jgi:Ca2+-binding RTX toxin-like protein
VLETCGCFDATVIGGVGNDEVFGGTLVFGNEGNDSLASVAALTTATTVFGGLGNDIVVGDFGRDTLQGNEGNDTMIGAQDVDTISGGAGNDWFAYEFADDDGDNAAGGGPVERITDVNFDQDLFVTDTEVTFAANLGAGTGADLNASANNAIAAAYALAGGGAAVVAAQFTFSGRTYLAIDQDTAGAFDDFDDLLLDITGATGSIGASDFIVVP